MISPTDEQGPIATSRARLPSASPVRSDLAIGLLTGCKDRPYAFGLAMALTTIGVRLDFVGSDTEDSPELHQSSSLTFHNLKRGWRRNAGPVERALKVLVYYVRLMRYVAIADAMLLHILWNNNIEYFDRTLLMLYYKALGKRITITAHNVNARKRDRSDSFLNRCTLKAQYHFADHIFVHTSKMKQELCDDFGVHANSVTVIRHPVNDAFPDTDLSPTEARERLALSSSDKVMLFFGRIRPYKGLEYLLAAFEKAADRDPAYRLVIAGESQKGYESHSYEIQKAIDSHRHRDRIIQRTGFIPDHEAEVYLKAADVMVLPYKDIFQSGVLFLAYSFGLPVIASDVGSFREEIIESETGFMCLPCDPEDLSRAIERYFTSDLFRELHWRRPEIRNYAFTNHSWNAVAQLTRSVYASLSRYPIP